MALNFKSKAKYKKWLAFKHIHLGKPKSYQKVTIAGRPHHVNHLKGGLR